MYTYNILRILTIVIKKIFWILHLDIHRDRGKVKIFKRMSMGANYLHDIAIISGGKNKVQVCIDGGGHVGETALELMSAFPKALIYSFEPASLNFAGLNKNTKRYKRIYPIKMGIGSDSGSAEFLINNGDQTGSFLKPADGAEKYVSDPSIIKPAGKETVMVVSLDQWVVDNNIQYIDLLKLDLQGYELEALKGARSILSNKMVLSIFMEVNFVSAYENQAGLAQLLAFCTDLGYRVVGLYPSEFNARHFHYRCGGDLLLTLEDKNDYILRKIKNAG